MAAPGWGCSVSKVISCRGLLAALAALSFQAGADSRYWEAEIGLATALRLHGDDRVTQKELYLEGSLEDSWDSGYYKAKGRARYDARYEGNQPYLAQARDDYRLDADWRHLYWGHYLGEGELTVGWQQVVWGRADELRVLDQVNPLDYREGVTTLLEESRIALPMVRYVRPFGDWELEALWVTDFEKNRPPAAGSEFDSPLFAAPPVDTFLVDSTPDYDGHEGFSYGLSGNGRVGDVDVSAVLLNARQHDPVYAIEGLAADGRIRLERQFPRYTMVGAGLAVDAGHSIVVRTEVAWFDNWRLTNPSRALGSDESPLLKALLGIDYLVRDWMISAQWQEQQVIDWRAGMLVDRREHLFTLSAEGSHAQDRLKSRLVAAFSPAAGDDALLQAILTYKPVDWLKLGLEVDLFFGREERTFGSYDRKDQLRFSVGYLF